MLHAVTCSTPKIPLPSLPSSFHPTTLIVALFANKNSSTITRFRISHRQQQQQLHDYTLSHRSPKMSSRSNRISKKQKKSAIPKGFRQTRVWTAEELAEKEFRK
jgi:hypothetical protein